MINNSRSIISPIPPMRVTSVFSPWEDFIIFILPLFIAFMAPDMFSKHASTFIHIIIFKAVIQSGHIFLTYFPAKEKKMHHESRMYLYVLLYFSVFVILNFISPNLFINAFAVASMFHIIHQHIGWYKKSQPAPDFLGKKLLFQMTFFFIIILWIFNLFPTPPGYIYGIDITAFMRSLFQISLLGKILLANFFCAVLIYLIFVQKNVIDRPLFFIGTFGWIFLGILFPVKDSRYFFTLYAIFSHGIGYTLYLWKKWPKQPSEGKYEWKNSGKLLLAAAVIGYLDTRVISYPHLDERFLAFLWIPSIFHYALDSKIWKSQKKGPAEARPL